MSVTITGQAGKLATGGFGVAGITGTVELTPRHPSGVRPSYALTGALLSEVDPVVIAVPIAAATTVLSSSQLRPAGCYHEVTWRLNTGEGEVEVIRYDVWLGPDGGTCDITDPVHRVGASSAPGLTGWPDTGPVPVYVAEGAP